MADGRRVEALVEQLTYGHVVAARLRHLVALDLQVLRMKPRAHERLSGRRLGLRDLVFVVRENQVFPT